MQNKLEIKGLGAGYGDEVILSEVSFAAGEGELISLLGVNGCGKSTLLRTIAGLLPPISGSISCLGRELYSMGDTERARLISSVFTGRSVTYAVSCREVVAMGRYPYTGRFGLLAASDEKIIDEALEMAGSAELADKDFLRLSDGQRQRVLLARALCQEPEILILDEPTSHLDVRYQIEFMELLRRLCRSRGLTVLLSIHESHLALAVSDKLLCLKDGGVFAFITPEAADGDMLKKLYGIDDMRCALEAEDPLMAYVNKIFEK